MCKINNGNLLLKSIMLHGDGDFKPITILNAVIEYKHIDRLRCIGINYFLDDEGKRNLLLLTGGVDRTGSLYVVIDDDFVEWATKAVSLCVSHVLLRNELDFALARLDLFDALNTAYVYEIMSRLKSSNLDVEKLKKRIDANIKSMEKKLNEDLGRDRKNV